VWTKITFLIDTVPPIVKDAETLGHDALPPSPSLKKLQLTAEEVASYNPLLCQATNCWMPTASCDSSHLCRGPSCGVRLHGTCGLVDVNENSDGNEMLRVCGRSSCVAGIKCVTAFSTGGDSIKCVTAFSTGGAKRKLQHERITPKRHSPWAHAHTFPTSLVDPLGED
jgi:hypothetical protein